jgi:hypothetical protein
LNLLQTPHEVNGRQIAPTVDIHQWFLNRGMQQRKAKSMSVQQFSLRYAF